jgi:signal transduction histidine kinase
VVVSTKQTPKHFAVRIEDKGRGMSAAEIAELGAYQQFNRVFHEQQGIGLGFVIAKRLVEYHGGELKVKSVEGQGTEITVQLPLVHTK